MFDQNQLAIVIPAYKATFLRETLQSIANQTDKRFHLYIGDDCSPYDLKSIVDGFTDKIPLTYKRFETNLGGKNLVAQWERCIALSKDEQYIWLFSDDDTMSPTCVESLYSLSDEERDAALIHFDIKMIDDFSGGEIKDLPKFPRKMSAGEFIDNKLRGKILSYVIEFVFTRSLYERVNGFQNFDLAWGSDFMTWVKMSAASANGIVTVNNVDSYVCWRKSNENISPDKSRPILLRKLNSLIENAAFIKCQLEQNPGKFRPLRPQFRFVRFPLGELLRNKENLSYSDIVRFCRIYVHKVGYPSLAMLALLKIISHKLLKL